MELLGPAQIRLHDNSNRADVFVFSLDETETWDVAEVWQRTGRKADEVLVLKLPGYAYWDGVQQRWAGATFAVAIGKHRDGLWRGHWVTRFPIRNNS